jgi:hypothetical protein
MQEITFDEYIKTLEPTKLDELLTWAGTQNLEHKPTVDELKKLIENREGFYLTACDACEVWGIESDRAEHWTDEGIQYGNWSEKADAWVHDECANDEHDVTTVVKYDNSGKAYVVKLTQYQDYCETCGDTECEHVQDANSVVVGTELHRVNAWRAWQEPKLADWLHTVADGWVTGFPDDSVGHKDLTYTLHDKLETGVPVEVWWIYHPTSNVFSTSSIVGIRDGEVDQFEQWCKRSLKADLEKLQYAFS